MNERKYIPVAVKRALLEETVYRCASCLCSIEHCEDDDNFFSFGEKAHINPHNETQDDSFENLITLCPSCHTKFDKSKDKKESLRRLQSLKRQWLGISGKYSKLEVDCLLDIFNQRNVPWISSNALSRNNNGINVPVVSLMIAKSSLFLLRNIVNDRLVDKIESNSNISIGDFSLAPVYLALSQNGYEFCKKLYE